jgi:hypothetical protein
MPSFAAPVAVDVGAPPNAVAVGHFEGASAPLDVVTANANGTVSVLLGKGDGTVQNPISITVGGTPDAVAVGDFLGNGLQDIAVANTNGTVTVILSNGNGTFAAPTTSSLGATPVGLAVADFNGDGKLDIVTANSGGTVSVLLGKGTGGFGAPITSTAGGTLTSVAVGDFNRDGKPDVVVGTETGLDILLGGGNGTFKLKQTVTFSRTIDGITFVSAVTSVAVADLTNHGDEDVLALANTGLSTLLGSGDGTVQAPVVLNTGGSGGVASFAVGDFNGDGKLDVVANNSPGYAGGGPTLGFLAGNSAGTFHPVQVMAVGETANALAVGDFRGTGKLDVVMASDNSSNTVAVLPGNGNGTFAVVPGFAAGLSPVGMAVGDFNGDGKPDLVTSGVGGLNVFLNNGDGTFRAGPTLATGDVSNVVVADFNGDGKADIAAVTGVGIIEVFLGKGNGTFQTPQVINLGINDSITAMVAGTFVTGKRPDLAVAVQFSTGTIPGAVRVLLNNGSGTFSKGQTINLSGEAEGLAAADVNGDGKTDLVTIDFLFSNFTRSVAVFLGNGNGTFQAPILTPTGLAPTSLAVGDFNGDGKPDLVLVDYFDTDESVLVMSGNGDGTFGKPLVLKFNTPLGFAAPVVGDFFGDGKLSFAITTGLGEVTVVRGNGDGTFQAPVNYLADFDGGQPNTLVVADFNGDGKPDLAATNPTADDVSVLLNTSPPPATGTVATTTTLTADATSAVSGQTLTLTARVTAATGTATGTVTFFDGTTRLGAVPLDPNGQARLLVSFTPGTHSLTAIFAGIEPFAASTSAGLSEKVTKDHTTTTLTVDTNGFGVGFVILNVTITPVAPGGGLPTGTVTFKEGNTILGTATVSGGQATLDLERTLPPGTAR